MAMTINTNMMSLNAQRNLSASANSLAISMQRLSSGLRINSAKDDAAGLAISEGMNTQVRGLNQAIRNANDGISLAQTAEGAMSAMGDMFQRMRELAVQAANGTNSTESWAALNAEYQALGAEINRVAASTTFNGLNIIGADAGATTFQIGANNGDTTSVTTTNMSTAATASIAITLSSTATGASAITAVDAAITALSTSRAALGAVQNTFEFTIQNLRNASENQAASRGRIVDADFAAETANLSRSQILQQAGTAMLSQANAAPQNVLTLLR